MIQIDSMYDNIAQQVRVRTCWDPKRWCPSERPKSQLSTKVMESLPDNATHVTSKLFTADGYDYDFLKGSSGTGAS